MWKYETYEAEDFDEVANVLENYMHRQGRLHTLYSIPVRGSAGVDSVRHYVVIEYYDEKQEETDDTVEGIAMVG